ncbi:hypothetical protein EB796_013445 [Bugula neritina]|uniref:Uncharacterized protein n=1 Tax=Bugula neritina TaxID=10212 RepID=A0A7J7JRE0_BUGNE|nr:hypothetical protein EB796_013445 [Bugula neritina]
MHINVMTTMRNYTRTQSQKETLLHKAIQLEDDIANQNSSNRYYKRSTGEYNGYLKLLYSQDWNGGGR